MEHESTTHGADPAGAARIERWATAHLDEAGALFVVLDGDGIVHAANPAAHRLLGGEQAALDGGSFLDSVVPEEREECARMLREARTGAAPPRELELRHGDRSCRWSFTVHRGPDGEERVVGSAHDVTALRLEERQHAEGEKRLRAIFEQDNRYVCLLEHGGRVIEANLKSLEVMHLRAADVAGVPFWETGWFSRSAEASDRIRTAVRQAAAGELVHLELNVRGESGGFRTVDVTIRPVRDEAGDVAMLLCEGRDVTELRLARDRETSMMKALATIGESAAILAHEIKNPITAIHYALQAVATELGEDQKAVIDDLVDRLKLLEKMMRRTLSFTRPLEFRPEVCALPALLEHVVADLEPVAARKNVTITLDIVDGCPDVTADPQLIGEVFTNLVTNALDALANEGNVQLRVEPGEPGQVRLLVADDGPGVPESLLASLFKPFFTTKSSGTGLGLALCRKILEEHGGSIEPGASPLGGACFLVTLPTAG